MLKVLQAAAGEQVTRCPDARRQPQDVVSQAWRVRCRLTQRLTPSVAAPEIEAARTQNITLALRWNVARHLLARFGQIDLSLRLAAVAWRGDEPSKACHSACSRTRVLTAGAFPFVGAVVSLALASSLGETSHAGAIGWCELSAEGATRHGEAL